jgi:F-type H+-transporting ATPase subunit delta
LKTNPIVRRYARAVFELGNEKKILDSVTEEVHTFSKLLESNKKLHFYFYSKEIETKRKMQVIGELLKGKASEIFVNFLLLLISKGRQSSYQQIVFEFDRLCDKLDNKIRAMLTLAIPLQSEQVEQIRKALEKATGSKVVLEEKIDPNILGGIIIQIDGKVIDASLSKQIANMAKKLKSAKTFASQ